VESRLKTIIYIYTHTHTHLYLLSAEKFLPHWYCPYDCFHNFMACSYVPVFSVNLFFEHYLKVTTYYIHGDNQNSQFLFSLVKVYFCVYYPSAKKSKKPSIGNHSKELKYEHFQWMAELQNILYIMTGGNTLAEYRKKKNGRKVEHMKWMDIDEMYSMWHGKITLIHLKFASPCIIIQFKKNQTTRCNSFSSLLLDVYLQLNMFRASSRPSSGAQQLQ